MAVKLKQNEQIGIGILAIVAVIIVGWFIIIEPQLSGIKATQKKLDDANTLLAQNKVKLTEAQQKKSQLEQANLNPNSFPSQINTSKEIIITDQIEKVLSLLKKNRNEIIKLRRIPYIDTDLAASTAAGAPPAPNTGAATTTTQSGLAQYLVEIPIEITIRGTYRSIGNFIKDINESSNIIRIYELQMVHDVSNNAAEATGIIPYTDPSRPLKSKIGLVFLVKTRSWSEQTKSAEPAPAPAAEPSTTEQPTSTTSATTAPEKVNVPKQ